MLTQQPASSSCSVLRTRGVVYRCGWRACVFLGKRILCDHTPTCKVLFCKVMCTLETKTWPQLSVVLRGTIVTQTTACGNAEIIIARV